MKKILIVIYLLLHLMDVFADIYDTLLQNMQSRELKLNTVQGKINFIIQQNAILTKEATKLKKIDENVWSFLSRQRLENVLKQIQDNKNREDEYRKIYEDLKKEQEKDGSVLLNKLCEDLTYMNINYVDMENFYKKAYGLKFYLPYISKEADKYNYSIEQFLDYSFLFMIKEKNIIRDTIEKRLKKIQSVRINFIDKLKKINKIIKYMNSYNILLEKYISENQQELPYKYGNAIMDRKSEFNYIQDRLKEITKKIHIIISNIDKAKKVYKSKLIELKNNQ